MIEDTNKLQKEVEDIIKDLTSECDEGRALEIFCITVDSSGKATTHYSGNTNHLPLAASIFQAEFTKNSMGQ